MTSEKRTDLQAGSRVLARRMKRKPHMTAEQVKRLDAMIAAGEDAGRINRGLVEMQYAILSKSITGGYTLDDLRDRIRTARASVTVLASLEAIV